MSVNYLVPAVLISLLAGCASNNLAATRAPVRARVLAELEQARKEANFPMTQANYTYPNWVNSSTAATASAAAPQVAAGAGTGSAPAVAIMSDGHPELARPATGKGSDSAH